MCGICGKFNFYSQCSVESGLINKMCGVLRHRGPDDQNTFIDGNIGLGITGLNIVDVDSCQPISNESKELQIIFNGEIYNFKELRCDLKKRGHYFKTRTDTEVIIHLYEEHGNDCLKYLNGMFAFAIWNKREKSLLLARDRFGIKPLFYTTQPNWFSFASEIKAILCDTDFLRRLDYSALHEYLSYNYVPSPKILIQNIKSLPAGHFLTCSEKEITLTKYWEPNSITEQILNESLYLEKFEELLKRAVLRQLDYKKATGIFLSGGIDSSALAYIIAQHRDIPVKAFSAQFSESRYDTTGCALSVASELNIDLRTVHIGSESCNLLPKIVWFCDSLVADPSIIPWYIMSHFAKDEGKVNVAISGEGADELMGGYDTYLADIMSLYYNRLIPKWVRKNLGETVNIFSVRDWPVGLSYRIRHFLKGAQYPVARAHYYWRMVFDEQEKSMLYSSYVKDIVKKDPFDIYGKYLNNVKRREDFNRILDGDINILLVNNMLARIDSASMASGLEVRVPFLDNDLAELIIGMPFRLKIRGLCTKYILKQAMSGKLPYEIIYARKRGLSVPVGRWMKEESKDMVIDYLSEERLKKIGCFNTKYINRLLHGHFSGREDNTLKIWGLLNFSIWHNLFIE